MTALALCLIAFGLSTDGAVAMAAQTTIAARVSAWDVARVFVALGSAHALMTAIGMFVGGFAGAWVGAVDHWIVLGVLGVLGLKAIREGLTTPDATGTSPGEANALSWTRLVPLAIATSLDALAVGVTLPLMGASMPLALLIMGLVPGTLAAVAAALAKRLRGALGPRLGLVGGAILIAIAVRTVIEHVSSGT